jgi:hypothetical protein
MPRAEEPTMSAILPIVIFLAALFALNYLTNGRVD